MFYASTPQRGLQILIPVFEKLAEEFDNIHLHVHSSFAIYGWGDADKQFEPLYELCKNHPKITYHGYTDYNDLREKMKNYHILSFPSIWPETACRTVIESMMSGVLCVHPNYAALWDTSAGLNFTYQGDQDIKTHANIFYIELRNAVNNIVNNREFINNYLKYIKNYADNRWSTKKAHYIWEKLLTELNYQFDTPESRKFPSQLYTYRT